MAIGSRSPLLNIPCWLDGIPELRFVQHLADLVLTASQRFVHRELTERVTYVFVSGRQETVPRGRFVLSVRTIVSVLTFSFRTGCSHFQEPVISFLCYSSGSKQFFFFFLRSCLSRAIPRHLCLFDDSHSRVASQSRFSSCICILALVSFLSLSVAERLAKGLFLNWLRILQASPLILNLPPASLCVSLALQTYT